MLLTRIAGLGGLQPASWLAAELRFSLVFLALGCSTPQEQARIARVESGLRPAVRLAGREPMRRGILEVMQRYAVPGVSVAVIDGGRLAWARGYGLGQSGGATAVDARTLFQAASISKPVAAMGALALVQDGRLTLDDDVNRWLTSWKLPASAVLREKPVTIRRLLSHSAGLTVHGFRGYARNEPVPTVVQVLNGAPPANSAPIRPDLVPGTQWRYSGGGYTMLQQLMADVTGTPFPELMRQLVLGPVGMSESTYQQPLPAARGDQGATGHRGDGAAIAGKWHIYPEMAAAGLWTTPSDLARFALEIQRSLAGERGRVLTPEMTRTMLAVQSGTYGLGLSLTGDGDAQRFSHGGSNEGFRTLLVGFFEGGRGAAVMTNSDNGGLVINEILRSIADEYGWPAFEQMERETVEVDPARLGGVAGRYALPFGQDTVWLDVTASGDSLIASFSHERFTRRLYPASDSTFFALEDGAELVFERGREGRATQVTIQGLGAPVRAARVK